MSVRTHFSAAEAAWVAGALGVDFGLVGFDLDQFRQGMDVELEHGSRSLATNVTGDDAMTTGRIALAHLRELPDYYTRLARMEAEALGAV